MNSPNSGRIDTLTNVVLALDVGNKRIGVAIGNSLTRLARPLTTLQVNSSLWMTLEKLILSEHVTQLVIGLPRNLNGNDTAQTTTVRQFTHELKDHFDLPVHFQDEALTSNQAEAELRARGRVYKPGDIDALAATLILSDYLNEVR